MKQKIIIILSILSACLLSFASQGHAYMGSSTSYKLDISDLTNSGAKGSSPSYALSSGITGDKFDGTGQSANYHLCAGFAEENYNNTHCGSALPGTLKIIVHVINDNTGTLVAANFTFHVKTGGLDVAGSPAPGAEAPGTSYTLAAGPYAVSINSTAGYSTTISGGCTGGGSVVVPAAGTKTCTITADDIAPAPPPPPPPTPPAGCTDCNGPGWPKIEDTQIVIPTQEITQETQIETPIEIPNIIIPPFEPPTQETAEVAFRNPTTGINTSTSRTSASESQPIKLLNDVWCAEDACFDQPIVVLKPAADTSGTIAAKVYIVRPWIIWMTVILLALFVILLGLYINAELKLVKVKKIPIRAPPSKNRRKIK